MQLSDKGTILLIAREDHKFFTRPTGYIWKIYKDVVGLNTVGIGHLVLPKEDFSKGLTKEESIDLFKTDVERFVANINRVVTTPLSQDEFDALVSFSFNIGTAGFNRSTVLKRINQGDKAGAADAFMMWLKPAVLRKRRQSEVLQFKSLI